MNLYIEVQELQICMTNWNPGKQVKNRPTWKQLISGENTKKLHPKKCLYLRKKLSLQKLHGKVAILNHGIWDNSVCVLSGYATHIWLFQITWFLTCLKKTNSSRYGCGWDQAHSARYVHNKNLRLWGWTDITEKPWNF